MNENLDILSCQNGKKYSYENIATHNWLKGKYDGSEGVANYLRKKSGEAFAAGNDSVATMLRSLANEVIKEISIPILNEYHKHQDEHPEEIRR